MSGTWKSVYHCKTGACAGQDFPAGPFHLVQAPGSSTVINGDSSGTLTGHTLILHTTATTGYTYKAVLTISADGRSWTGTLSDSNGTSGTDTGTRLDKPGVSLAVSISSPVGAKGADRGDVFDVTVRVKARGGDLKDVRLSKGLTVAGAPLVGAHKKHYESCGNAVVVTSSPPEASGFPLADGETRSFVFRVRAHKPGPATLKVDAIGVTDTETTEEKAATVVHVNQDPLTQGGQPIKPGAPVCQFAQSP